VTQTGNQAKMNSSAHFMVIKTKALPPLSDLNNNLPHQPYLKLYQVWEGSTGLKFGSSFAK